METTYNSPSQQAWKRLRKNRPAIYGLCWISLVCLFAILGYSVVPDATPQCNQQMLRIQLQSPGFSTDVIQIKNDLGVPRRNFFSRMAWGQPANYIPIPAESYQWNDGLLKITAFGGDPIEKTLLSEAEFTVEHRHYILGTDQYGRDILSRLILGARISLVVGFIAVFISLSIGISLGAMAGYIGGWVDDLVVFLINTVWSVPTLLLVIAIVLAFGQSIGVVFLAVGLTMWVDVARIVRGQVLSIKKMQYVEAAQVFGFSNARVLLKHILPNVLGPVMVVAAANFATAILLEAGLGYLGFGVQPPAPSWGTMLNENYGYAIGGKPLLALIPAIAVMLLVLSFNLLGNGLRDALDVRMNN